MHIEPLLQGRQLERSSDPILRVDKLSKSFGPVRVLSGVDLSIASGEIVGLVGANGAGKSTLVKHLTGYHTPTTCERLTVRGEDRSWPLHDRAIVAVHQDQGFVDSMTVLENVAIREFRHRPLRRLVRWTMLEQRVARVLDRVGLGLGVHRLVSSLSPGERALLAVARALLDADALDASETLLLLDEPTAALGPADSDQVLSQAQELAAQGSGIVLITHRLDEIRSVADRVLVLRDGHVVHDAGMPASDADLELLMFGASNARTEHEFTTPSETTAAKARDVAMEVTAVAGVPMRRPLRIRAGEIVGVTGMRGSGHEELAYQIVGASGKAATVNIGSRGERLTPRQASQRGIVLVSGNRQRDGLWLAGTVLENMVIARRHTHGRKVLVHSSNDRTWAMRAVRSAQVHPPRLDRSVSTFSGGNQQKVCMARWFDDRRLRVLLLHEPTQGIDLRSRREILEQVRDQAVRMHVAVAIFSSDSEALAAVADRVIIMRQGQPVSELVGDLSDGDIDAAVYFAGGGEAASNAEEPVTAQNEFDTSASDVVHE